MAKSIRGAAEREAEERKMREGGGGWGFGGRRMQQERSSSKDGAGRTEKGRGMRFSRHVENS